MSSEGEYDSVVYQEGEFSVRVGTSMYFIQHDPCNYGTKNQYPRQGVAHDSRYDGEVIHSGSCATCGKEYSTELGGFIQLLNWSR